MSTGYANRIIHIAFPELAEPKLDENGKLVAQLDEAGEPVLDKADQPTYVPSEQLWVSIRNPKTMTMDELAPGPVPIDPETNLPVEQAANDEMFKIIAKLVVGWNMYDAKDFQIDQATGQPLPQRKLALPATPETVRGLPAQAVNRIADFMSRASA